MEINRNAVICAARHYIAAHESAVHDIPVDFGAICAECQLFQSCKGRWLETAAPIFEAADLHPKIFIGKRLVNNSLAGNTELQDERK